MLIEIKQHKDYPIKEPLYCFGQVVEDMLEDDHGYVAGMQYDETLGWQYNLRYLDLGVYGRWINESDLKLVLEISASSYHGVI
jgi:hypothetical protein